MTNILAFSGRKGAGKNTAANYVLGLHLFQIGLLRQPYGHFTINDYGQLVVFGLDNRPDFNGVLDIINNESPAMQTFLEEFLHPYFKFYSFADLLKQNVCMDILGLTRQQCYGSDDDKNELTHLKWEDMPGVITPEVASSILCDIDGHGEDPNKLPVYIDGYNKTFDLPSTTIAVHEAGQMTAREVMQYVGSDIFRKMYGNVWVDATIRKIQKDNSLVAVITDCRFPNEVKGVQDAGGKVVRLTRNPYKGQDEHISETALDDYEGFDAIIDNDAMNIPEQCRAVYYTLHPMGLVEKMYDILGNN